MSGSDHMTSRVAAVAAAPFAERAGAGRPSAADAALADAPVDHDAHVLAVGETLREPLVEEALERAGDDDQLGLRLLPSPGMRYLLDTCNVTTDVPRIPHSPISLARLDVLAGVDRTGERSGVVWLGDGPEPAPGAMRAGAATPRPASVAVWLRVHLQELTRVEASTPRRSV